MKKIMICFFLLVTMAGCGNKPEVTPEVTPEVKKEEPKIEKSESVGGKSGGLRFDGPKGPKGPEGSNFKGEIHMNPKDTKDGKTFQIK